MLEIIFGLILLGVSVFVAVVFFLSFLPDWIQDAVGLGCGCLVALVGLLIIIVPIVLLVLWLIGTFCD